MNTSSVFAISQLLNAHFTVKCRYSHANSLSTEYDVFRWCEMTAGKSSLNRFTDNTYSSNNTSHINWSIWSLIQSILSSLNTHLGLTGTGLEQTGRQLVVGHGRHAWVVTGLTIKLANSSSSAAAVVMKGMEQLNQWHVVNSISDIGDIC